MSHSYVCGLCRVGHDGLIVFGLGIVFMCSYLLFIRYAKVFLFGINFLCIIIFLLLVVVWFWISFVPLPSTDACSGALW